MPCCSTWSGSDLGLYVCMDLAKASPPFLRSSEVVWLAVCYLCTFPDKSPSSEADQIVIPRCMCQPWPSWSCGFSGIIELMLRINTCGCLLATDCRRFSSVGHCEPPVHGPLQHMRYVWQRVRYNQLVPDFYDLSWSGDLSENVKFASERSLATFVLDFLTRVSSTSRNKRVVKTVRVLHLPTKSVNLNSANFKFECQTWHCLRHVHILRNTSASPLSPRRSSVLAKNFSAVKWWLLNAPWEGHKSIIKENWHEFGRSLVLAWYSAWYSKIITRVATEISDLSLLACNIEFLISCLVMRYWCGLAQGTWEDLEELSAVNEAQPVVACNAGEYSGSSKI